jgi:hypothetical protein
LVPIGPSPQLLLVQAWPKATALSKGLYEAENPTVWMRLPQQAFFATPKQQVAIPEHELALGQAQRSMPWTRVATEATTMTVNMLLKTMGELCNEESKTGECRKIIA